MEFTESTTCAEVVQAVQKYSPDLPLAERTLRLILPRHEAPLQLSECPSKPLLEAGELCVLGCFAGVNTTHTKHIPLQGRLRRHLLSLMPSAPATTA